MWKVNCPGYSGLNVRKTSKQDSEVRDVLKDGTKLEIIKKRNGMGQLKEGGWVNLEFVEEIPEAPLDEAAGSAKM